MKQKQEPMVEERDENEDIMCCHRIRICPTKIRRILVTDPIIKILGPRLTWGSLFWAMTVIAMVLLGWLLLYSLLGDTMLPRNNGFGLYCLAFLSYFIGWAMWFIPKLNIPPPIGMLMAGIIVHNCGLYNVHKTLGASTASKIRTVCLTFLVLRAGFQLSTTTLSKHALIVIILAIIPATFELIALTLCLKFILLYDWCWAVMCGSMLTCMSPAVTINAVLVLAEEGYGEDKGIAGILSTSACIESVYTVSIFAICFSIVFTKDDIFTEWWSFLPYGFRDLIIGIIMGFVLGIFFVFFPHRSYKYVTTQRMICLVLGSLVCMTGSWEFHISGRGILGSFIMSFIATTGWKILSTTFDMVPFRQMSYITWHLIQPILLGLIGANIDFIGWTLPRFGLHLLCIYLGVLTRAIVICFATVHTQFSWKERLFIIICWISKGTLQAGFGPMALDRMDEQSTDENIALAMDAVRISATSILFLGPVLSLAINHTGPYLLSRLTYEENERDRALSYVRIVSLSPFRLPGEASTK